MSLSLSKLNEKLNIFSTRERIKQTLYQVVMPTESRVHVENFHIGRTHQQLGNRLHEHKILIDKSLTLENKNGNFDSALAQNIYENPDHLHIFEEATLISTLNCLPQSFKDAIEIKKNI